MMSTLLSDLRFTLRLMRRGPAFFATVLIMLVAGIGATTAMFSIVHSLLLESLPYEHPERLTMVWATQPHVERSPASIPDFLDWKAQASDFDALAATNYIAPSLTSEGAKPEQLAGASVTGDYFMVFSQRALLGRVLVPADDRVDGARVAVISAGLWQRRFGSDASVVGRTITLDALPFTVVGVAAEGFRFGGPYSDGVDVWTPLAPTLVGYAHDSVSARGGHFLHVVGRRRAGVTLEHAQLQLAAIAKGIEVAYPDSNTRVGVHLLDLHEEIVGSSRDGVLLLFAAVSLVFLIVCANIANLLLTRAQTRRAEMATRGALGASPARLAAQIVTETVVLFLFGALGGALLARSLVDVLRSGLVGSAGARTIDVRVDATALLVTSAVCLLCGIVFGLVPALAVARIEPHAVIKEDGARAGVGRSQRTIRAALVIAQVALACALLVGSALALKAFARVAATPPGFEPADLATVRLALPLAKYKTEADQAGFAAAVVERIAAQPGVESVAVTSSLPMGGSNSNSSFMVEGRAPWPHGQEPLVERNLVTPGYFRTMKIPILRGRELTDADRAGARPVIVINQTMAEAHFPGMNPIGQRIDWEGDDEAHRWLEIVGVCGDVRRRGLALGTASEAFAPMAQLATERIGIVARSARAASLLQELPALVQGVDADQAVGARKLMTERVAETLGSQRYVAFLLGAFALFALVLASLGIFGLMSYATGQRTRELGIRLALGSTPEAVVLLVMRGGLGLVGAGLAIGLGTALLVGRVLASRVAGVAAFDLEVFAVVPAILAVAGLVACFVPVLRAVRMPPAMALRYE